MESCQHPAQDLWPKPPWPLLCALRASAALPSHASHIHNHHYLHRAGSVRPGGASTMPQRPCLLSGRSRRTAAAALAASVALAPTTLIGYIQFLSHGVNTRTCKLPDYFDTQLATRSILWQQNAS